MRLPPCVTVRGEHVCLERSSPWVEYSGPTIRIYRAAMSKRWFGIDGKAPRAVGPCRSLEEAMTKLEARPLRLRLRDWWRWANEGDVFARYRGRRG